MSRKRNPANLSQDLEMLIINQIRLLNKVKRLLNDEDSDVGEVVDNLKDLNQNTNDLTVELLGESIPLMTSGPSVNLSQYDFYVDLVDQSQALQEALYLVQRSGFTVQGHYWQNCTKAQKLFYIANKSTDTMIKEVHKVLLSNECGWSRKPPNAKLECKKLPDEFVEFLQFMLDIRNMNFAPQDQAHLYFPEIGMRFERSNMIATEEVMNGEVIGVLMPGILDLKMKALVVVRT